MSGDPLSDALALIDAHCVLARAVLAGHPWSLTLRAYAPLMLVVPARGEFWLTVPGSGKQLLLAEGDIAVVHGDLEQVMSSRPDLEPEDGEELFRRQGRAALELGDSPDVTVLGCHIALDRNGEDLLLAALPPVTHIRAQDGQAPVLHWLLDRLLAEMSAEGNGSAFAARQYAGLLFVEVLRGFLADPSAGPPSWLRVLATPALAPAAHAMQADPGRAWTLEHLARTVAMSRSTFAERFREAAGVPPLTYLLHWRMRLAERALREDDVTIASLSHSLGYATESSFSHAFKRTLGLSPGQFRERARAEMTDDAGPVTRAPSSTG
ncbi:AraC family transcriptional regulator [Kineosporia sp. J2-2]|uniref:AraC family transcriptional regulator n=1 Tax=Kineosporia corallincola TaxID=2835133 RepID=A0ABS5TH75_9ACTN|nr:AraC family transcriptional regulator [Kineosporia corallincola]MBT0769526.1 AraC family transcriptional regulator [Kineosporia corallincola]